MGLKAHPAERSERGYTGGFMQRSVVMAFTVVLSLATCARAAPALPGQSPKEKETVAPVYDLADTDLAAIPEVDSRRIAVFGVKLGDPHEEVRKRFGKDARPASWNSKLLFVRLGRTPGQVGVAGLVLSFDGRDRVASMSLETGTRTGELPEVLASKLQGKTRALFLNYSDELRLKIFGPEAKKYRVPNPPLTVYQYPLRGLSLGVYRDDQGREHVSGLLLAPPQPIEKPTE